MFVLTKLSKTTQVVVSGCTCTGTFLASIIDMQDANSPWHLPLEIAFSIIHHVSDRDTLLTLCLTSKALSRDALKYLYGDIADCRDNATLHLLLIGTLLSNPSLALLVRSYGIIVTSHIVHVPGESREDSLEEVARSSSAQKYAYIWALLPRALSLMSNLKRLSFLNIGIKPCAHHFLQGNLPFRLKNLEWGSGGEGEEMMEFLSAQDELEVLSVTLAPGDFQLPPSACQRLVEVSGNFRTAIHFLRGRQTITRVRWDAFWKYAIDNVGLLNAEWGRVTHFSMVGPVYRTKLSSFANGLFDSLVSLELNHIHNVGHAFDLERN